MLYVKQWRNQITHWFFWMKFYLHLARKTLWASVFICVMGKITLPLSKLCVATARALRRKIRSYSFPQEVTSSLRVHPGKILPRLDKSLPIFSLVERKEEDAHWSVLYFHHSHLFPVILRKSPLTTQHSLLVSLYNKSCDRGFDFTWIHSFFTSQSDDSFLVDQLLAQINKEKHTTFIWWLTSHVSNAKLNNALTFWVVCGLMITTASIKTPYSRGVDAIPAFANRRGPCF